MPPGAFAAALVEEAEATLEWVARPLAGVARHRGRCRAPPSPARSSRLPRRRGRWRSWSARHTAARWDGRPRQRRRATAPRRAVPRRRRAARLLVGRLVRPIRSIGVGFVATPEADEALCAAVGIALRTGAAIRALSVVELPPAVTVPFGWNYAELEQVARDDLSQSLRAHARRRHVAGGDRGRGRRRLRRRRARSAVRGGRPPRLRLAWSRPARPRDARERRRGRAAQGALPGARHPARRPRRLRDPPARRPTPPDASPLAVSLPPQPGRSS